MSETPEVLPVKAELVERSEPTSDAITFNTLQRMAKAIAASGLFGLKTEAQAVALMLVAQAEGRHPAMAARDYDIIQGRPAKRAEAMLRDFLASGGAVEWHTLNDTKAEATFSHPQGGSVRISWDMERVKKAGLRGKDMYDKYPRQMLRSRCVSEGVRTVCPAATSGMYVPEEVQEFGAERSEKSGGVPEGTRPVIGEKEVGRPTAPAGVPLKDTDLSALSKRPAALDAVTDDERDLDQQLARSGK